MSPSIMTKGAIDCDIHPSVPNIEALLPYFNVIGGIPYHNVGFTIFKLLPIQKMHP